MRHMRGCDTPVVIFLFCPGFFSIGERLDNGTDWHTGAHAYMMRKRYGLDGQVNGGLIESRSLKKKFILFRTQRRNAKSDRERHVTVFSHPSSRHGDHKGAQVGATAQRQNQKSGCEHTSSSS